MALSKDLISQFVKATKDKQDTKKETVVYGTIDVNDTNKVIIDGSNISTPVSKTVVASQHEEEDESGNKVSKGDRVIVTIKNHTATVTGNVSNPAAREYDTVSVGSLEAIDIKTNSLESNKADIEDLHVVEADIDYLKTNKADIDALNVVKADVEYLKALDIDTEKLNAAYAFVDDLEANHANVDELLATVAKVDTLIFGSATGDVIQTSFSNSVIAQLGDAQIKSAMVDKISADKITALHLLAGSINADNIIIRSSDGKLDISDNTIKISDGTRTRVQIGKDASNDYSINVWDQNGKLMFSEGGITDAAIKKAIIRNDMVSDTANIHASKLDIDSLFEEINDSSNTIKSTQIYVDDKKQTLDVAFKTLTTEMTTQGSTISSQGTQISAIQGQISSKIWQQDINTARDALEEQTESLSTQYSTLEQNLKGFKAVVSDTYATKTSLNDLEIGGRNLLLNTGGNEFIAISEGGVYSRSAGVKALTITDGILTLECEANPTNGSPEIYYRFMNPAITNNLYNLEAGETYTLSGKVQISTASGAFTRLTARMQNNKPGAGWSDDTITTIVNTDVDDWMYFTSTFTIDASATGCYTSLQLYYTESWSGTIQVKELKLEKSSKASGWTPAPEDLMTIENASKTYTTKVEFNIQAEQITSTVSRVEAVENVEIGGVNLLKNAGHFTKNNPIVLSSSSKDGYVVWFGDRPIYTTSAIKPSTKIVLQACTDGVWGNTHGYVDDNSKKIVNIWMYWYDNIEDAKNCTNSYITARMYPADGVSSGKYVWNITSPNDDRNTTGEWYVCVRLNTYSDGTEVVTHKVWNIKIERGDKCTDWSPAPEDIETQISATETLIAQTAEDLTVLINSSAKTATNYLNFSSSGLVIGDLTADTLGKNVLIDSDSVDIRNGTATLASFGADYLYLAKNSRDAKIDLCNGLAEIYHEIDTKGYSVFNIDTTYGLSYIKMSAPMSDLLVLENTNSTNGVIIKGMINGNTVGGFGLLRDGNMVRYGSDADEDNPVENIILDTGNFLTEMDDGWHYTGGYGDNFTQYNNEDYAKVRYRKIGGMVEIRGVMRPTKIITGSSTQHELFSLPEGYRPDSYMYQRCQADGVRSWLLTISPSGVVSFSRYGNGTSYIDAETTAWLPFQVTYFVN